MTSVEGMRSRDGSPYLGEAAYEAFWAVALATGGIAEQKMPFQQLNENAKWAWHSAGMAAVREVAA